MVVVVVVFVSIFCVFVACGCVFALWCLIKKCKKKKNKKTVQEIDIIRADERLKVKEGVVKGPHGSQAVVLTIDDDKRFEEEIIKKQKEIDGKHLHGKNGDIKAASDVVETGESSSNPGVYQGYRHVEYKS